MAVVLSWAVVWKISYFVKQCCARLIILYSFWFFSPFVWLQWQHKKLLFFRQQVRIMACSSTSSFFVCAWDLFVFFFAAHRFSVVLHCSVVRIVAENANRMLFENFFDCRAQCRGPFCFGNRCSMDLIQSQPMCIGNPVKSVQSSSSSN